MTSTIQINNNKTPSSLSSRLVVVFGVTGHLGSSIADTLLRQEGKWRIRGVCRDPTSLKAKSLTFRDVEIVQWNWDDPYHESLDKMMEGAYACFAMSLPRFYGVKTSEQMQGKAIADGAKRAGVKHFIWLTLPNVQKESGGEIHLREFTDKSLVADYLKTLDFPYLSLPMPGLFYQTFQRALAPSTVGNEVVFRCPTSSSIAAFDAGDFGEVVKILLENPEKWNGIELPLCGSLMTPDEYVKTFSLTTNRKATLQLIPLEDLQTQGENALALVELFKWINKYGFFGDRDFKLGRHLFRGLRTFEQYLKVSSWLSEEPTSVQSIQGDVH